MLTITEEYERRMLKAKGGKKDKNIVFYSNNSGKGRKGGSSSEKDRNVECFNCHRKGHKKLDCWAPGGRKEGQGPNHKGKSKAQDLEEGKEMAAAAKDKTEKKADDSNEAWMALIDSGSEEEGKADSDFDSDSFDDLFKNNWSENWFTKSEELGESFIDDDIPSPQSESDDEDKDPEDDNNNLLVCKSPIIPLDEEANTTLTHATLAGIVGVKLTDVDLYDSGATCHMSGFHHRFINLVEIEPKPITTADK
jgi:hypothetical protein